MSRMKQADLAKMLSGPELTKQLYLSQMILIFIALLLGFFFFDSFSSFPALWEYRTGPVLLGLLLGVAVAGIDIFLMNRLPKRYYDDGGINEKIFRGMPVWKIALTTILVAIAEEILFRGVIQTKVGLFWACIVFAAVHVRYWSHWYLAVNVTVLSFFIGWVYQWSGELLLPVIAMHFAIDFLLGVYLRLDNRDKEGKRECEQKNSN